MSLTFRELGQKYLAWVKTHQSQRTHEWYSNYINMFCAYDNSGDTPAYELKPHQVQTWVDSHGDKWGANYRGGAVVAIKRVFNWAESLGYGEGNPIKKLPKPPAERRKSYAKPDGVAKFLAAVDAEDPFHDLLTFCWACGCRPQEARHIEPRHVDLAKQLIMFPAKESKGKRVERKILINKTTLPIIEKLMATYTEGKLFRNTRGEAWTKFALCNRMYRLSEQTGVKITAYDLRHGWCTRKLKEGHGHMQIAACMGHSDGSMIAKVYSHVHEDEEHLRTIME